jgi:AraC-like DNA-binding protein/mannose-6-phosphate isomerase-like protein (cupin superfamily)
MTLAFPRDKHGVDELRFSHVRPGIPLFAGTGVIGPGEVAFHRHEDHLEVLAVLSGSGEHLLRRGGVTRRERLRPGQIFLFRPIDEHHVAGDASRGMRIINVAFAVAAWQRFADLAGIDDSWTTTPDPPMATFDPRDTAVLRPFEQAIEAYERGPTTLDLIRFWTDLLPILLPPADTPGAGAPVWLAESVRGMRDEANLRGGVRRLVELSHVSGAHLSRSIRRYFGTTPTELVLDLQLHHATVLLRTTRDSIGAISQRCGFASPSYFSRRFRGAYLVSPLQYRRRSLGGFVGTRHPGRLLA